MIQNAIPVIISWVIMSVLYGVSVAALVRKWHNDIIKYKRKIAELEEIIGEQGDYSPAFPEDEESK